MSVDVEITNAKSVQILRLTRAAKKNALTGAMYKTLCDAIEAGDADPAIAAHVLSVRKACSRQVTTLAIFSRRRGELAISARMCCGSFICCRWFENR